MLHSASMPDDFKTSPNRSLSRFALNAWLAFAFIVVLVSAYGQSKIGFNNDNMTLAYQTYQMLHGAILYVDYTDVSPPMIHLLYAIPVMLSDATGITLPTLTKLFTLALVALSLVTSVLIMRGSDIPKPARYLVISAIGITLLFASFIYQLFADREHLMMILVIPFFILYVPGVRRQELALPLRITAASMAAIGFSIKPYFYVFYLACMGFTIMHGRSLKPLWRDIENLIVIGWGFLFLIIVFVFFPAYPFDVLPLGFHTYSTLSWPWASKWGVMTQDLLGTFGLAGLIGAGIWIAMEGSLPRWLEYMLWLLAAGLVSYALNGGWRYTQYPFIAISLVLTIIITGALFDILSRKDRGVGSRIGAMLMLILSLSQLVHAYMKPAIERARQDLSIQRYFGHPLELFIPSPQVTNFLGPHLYSHPRFVHLSINSWGVNINNMMPHTTHVGRFDYLWMMPGLLAMEKQNPPPEYYEKLARYVSGSIAYDLTHRNADMLIVDKSQFQRHLPESFDILAWLKKDPVFVDAIGHYEMADSLALCNKDNIRDCAYEIYYRKAQ